MLTCQKSQKENGTYALIPRVLMCDLRHLFSVRILEETRDHLLKGGALDGGQGDINVELQVYRM